MRGKAPATVRNRDPIAEVLAEELPVSGLVLEVASGTGEHAVHFARRFPHLKWQPSDPDDAALRSITAWRAHDRLANCLPPLALDATSAHWPLKQVDAVVCINMVHISPPKATEGLLRRSSELLGGGQPLILYGPYLQDGVETAPTNLAFDADLKVRNPTWGLRRLEWLDTLARRRGFDRTRCVAMPANNLTLIYRRRI